MEDFEKEIEGCDALWSREYQQEVIYCLLDVSTGITRNKTYYDLRRNYKVLSLAGVNVVAKKRSGKIMALKDNVTAIICKAHLDTNHDKAKATHMKISETYPNIPISLVRTYVSQCERCNQKPKFEKKRESNVVNPITAENLNHRGQVILIDFQDSPDRKFKYILNYQDNTTKFRWLRPMMTKSAGEVARILLHIFLDFGAPSILESETGRKFTAEIIHEMNKLWPNIVLVNGRPRHSRSPGSIEKDEKAIKKSLNSWMEDNRSTCLRDALGFVQWNMNTTSQVASKTEPYRAMFSCTPKFGLNTFLSTEFLVRFPTGLLEEEIEKLIDGGQNGETPGMPKYIPKVKGPKRCPLPKKIQEQSNLQPPVVGPSFLGYEAVNIQRKSSETIESPRQDFKEYKINAFNFF